MNEKDLDALIRQLGKVPSDTLSLKAAAALRELRAERDALREDAERYQWLREQPTMARSIGRYAWSDELDALIDAARRKP
jgi:hypothetical protein